MSPATCFWNVFFTIVFVSITIDPFPILSHRSFQFIFLLHSSYYNLLRNFINHSHHHKILTNLHKVLVYFQLVRVFSFSCGGKVMAACFWVSFFVELAFRWFDRLYFIEFKCCLLFFKSIIFATIFNRFHDSNSSLNTHQMNYQFMKINRLLKNFNFNQKSLLNKAFLIF